MQAVSIPGQNDSSFLKIEQEKTLASARRKYGFFATFLFVWMDLVYGRKRTNMWLTLR